MFLQEREKLMYTVYLKFIQYFTTCDLLLDGLEALLEIYYQQYISITLPLCIGTNDILGTQLLLQKLKDLHVCC